MTAHSTPRELSISNALGSDRSFVFGEVTYGQGAVFGPMSGSQLEAVYLRTGRVEVRHDGQVFALNAPAVAFVASRRKLEYRYGPTAMNNVLWCQCVSQTLDADQIDALVPFCGALNPSAAATSLMKIGAELPSSIHSEMHEFAAALGIAILEELLGRKRMQENIADVPQQALQVRRYIEENYSSEITMRTLSRISGLTPQHLNKVYRTAFRENPLAYLWRLRTRRGAYLLRHTGMPISQIAYQSGFKTPNHFSRLIKEKYGISPRRLRSDKWQGQMGP